MPGFDAAFSPDKARSWRVSLISLALGVCAALGQAPWSLWWISLPAFLGAFLLYKRTFDAGQAAWRGWLFGVGYFGLALFWIVEPFLVDIARHGWMAPFALIFLSGGLALLWAATWAVSRRIGGVGVLVIIWVAVEMLRSVLFTGFPWATIGHIWIGTPVMQMAAFGGAPLLSLIALGIVGALFLPRRTVAIGIAATIFTTTWTIGLVILISQQPTKMEKTVRLVQPNAAQHLKWKSEMIPVFFQRQLSMTSLKGDPDAIIWPETSIAYRLDRAEPALSLMAEAAAGTPLVFGANAFVDGAYRNTLVVMDETGSLSERYDKHHLVPFGEYVPFGDLLGQLGIAGLAARDGGGFAPGPGPQLVEIPGLGKALPLICYELIFPRNLRNVPRADYILQITNDAWFGEISGPYQHLAQAMLRAVEQGLPLIRAANTGVSAVIDPVGRVIANTPLNREGYLDADLPNPNPVTFYSEWGDWPMRIVLLISLCGVLVTRIRAHD
ncbi:apolipoprotein N-acyltransferase [Litoreibacter roseus]|uniref:Apolipoprotein N-acyltransferase n=1 Tax=Litoreibacter roseus TaxID=2601869 RepID=A0A6N6JD06_9RHOB|nr:apolipoprotein N-acyltransferase [Litoreibacter roseus]GFE63082.1 apolipoprotein N-acyltransferase [Litoreibacter roseus]